MERPESRHAPEGDLLRRANERLRNKKVPRLRPNMAEVDMRALVHELQVHQIELEMQNEELRRAKLETEESRREFHELFDTAPVAYLTLDERGDICEANLAAGTLLALSQYALVRRPFHWFVAPSSRADFLSFWRSVGRGHLKQTCELRLVNHAKVE